MSGDLRDIAVAVHDRMRRLAGDEQFEEAATWRERLGHLASASLRTHRLTTLSAAAEIVAAEPTPDHGWDIHVLRHGRLAAAGHAAPGTDPRDAVETLCATAEVVAAVAEPAPAALTEETFELLRWLDSPGVRLVRAERPLSLPIHCGGDIEQRLGQVRQAKLPFGKGSHRDDVGRPVGPVDARTVTRMLSA